VEIFTSQAATPVSMTPVANLPLVSTTMKAVSINKHRCQIFPPESLVSLILVAMSKIPANCHWYQWHLLQINIRLFTLKWPSRKFFFICWSFYPKVSLQKNWNFSDWRLFPVATGEFPGGAPWAAKISKNLWKNLKGPNGSRAWGKMIDEKNLKSKILWYCPFLTYKKSEITYEAQTINPAWIISNKVMLWSNTLWVI